ncbi:MAG: 8-oxo-dGTP diphosphatase MutT [Gammaproteobacteria bacterium]|nr:8-oxo-dGTP diphosphatase MutT [Gammaproteobacteria bacterium]MBT3859963.1 8-oxo-dGTP diphosphatase MutT [Gammaproteobacteria bacterium]MBT3986425.1 8-oxo-dGTP diphosphatase MutT [Gammaproteobacteria bacterium]MBT4254825.1 8-oxo-dGTP diphosphatase MutT [Gammaproteobacteria bacterium]MBT4582985.1 8-oxo-dGTP diphosphatase MutT [Gammaproteobacteria bacterium]
MSKSKQSPVHVAVGVILDLDRRVLVSKRHIDSHQGGYWEFPGGKVEVGETVERALSREIKEELGLEILTAFPLQKITHEYHDKSVLLDVYLVASFTGEAMGLEGQAIKWQPLDSLAKSDFPAANAEIIKTLQLPEELTIMSDVSTLDK